jgi:hypothetical protein
MTRIINPQNDHDVTDTIKIHDIFSGIKNKGLVFVRVLPSQKIEAVTLSSSCLHVLQIGISRRLEGDLAARFSLERLVCQDETEQ